MDAKYIYSRPETLTDRGNAYCAGCGHGTAQTLIAEIIDELGIREKTICVAPVGCAVESYNYFDVDTSEAAHGRVPAVATGIKRARPDLVVFGYQGDGDLASIGLAEIVHAANRGENYTTIFINNTVYGMTGGQLAPTTLVNQKTMTSPEGRDPATMGYPMRMCELISTLESPYLVARTALDSPAGVRKTRKMLLKAFQYQITGKGFCFIEILSACPTHWHLDSKASMDYIKDVLIPVFPLKVFRDRGVEE
ncbi:MAG: 2-oxoglutarate oxidoreductase [Kiritimatiellae bacterium]|nr:2-oxoglutarate oxidoreductase [Kiritimatiellia bacterium]